MAGGIPLSAKFDNAIAEPLDSKLESVSTFSELASTSFPYKGMQKLVEDEGDNGTTYILGTDLVTWAKSNTSVNVSNGLTTLTNSDIGLGGTLTENTTIDLDSKTLDLTNIKSVNILSSNGTGLSIDDDSNTTTLGDGNSNELYIESDYVTLSNNTGSNLQLDSDTVTISNATSNISIDSDGVAIADNINNHFIRTDEDGIVLSDSVNSIDFYTNDEGFNVSDNVNNVFIKTSTGGFELNADYSANYTNRSLVDKEYVDKISTQLVDGGGASSIYSPSQIIDGGNA